MAKETILYEFLGDSSSLHRATNDVSKMLDKLQSGATKSLGVIQNTVNGIIDSFTALAGVKVGNLFAEGAKGAIDYVENLNLFNVAMDTSIAKGTAFVNKMQEVYGMDPSNLMRYAGYFYQLNDAVGMSAEASATMSLSMTKAANDIASLYNTDIETVVDNLSSGIQGMSMAVKKYGMDIRATTLEQTALKYGIKGEVESMSEANRKALRYITMLEQTQNALKQTTTAIDGTTTELGDFARNIESPANQLRIFKEQMSQLGRAVGNFIVAPLQKALPYVNGFIMALRILVNFLATITGVSVKASDSLSSVGDSAEGVDAIGAAASKATKKLKQLIAPFDELNVLQESSDKGDSLSIDGALDPALAKALEEMELNLENITMKANQVRDAILGFLGLEVTTDPITQEQIIQWNKESFMTNVMGSLDTFKNWFADLSPLAQGAIALAGLVAGLAAVSGIVSTVMPVLFILSDTLSILSTAFSLLTSPVGLVIAALALLLTFSEEFRTSFVELFSQVGSSLWEWGGILAGIFATVGTDIVAMWDTHIQPTITAIGDALAPALETLGSLWDNLSIIVSDIFRKISNLWSTVLKPVIEGALEIIQDLADMFKKLWQQYVGPVIEYIGDGLEDLWTNTFSPLADKVIDVLGEFWAMIMSLWNNVLKPLINWLIDVLGPVIKNVFISVWDAIKPIFTSIGGAISILWDAFKAIIKYLKQVFAGEWKSAWNDLKKSFSTIWDAISSSLKGQINAIIGTINGLISAVESGLNYVISGMNRISVKIPDWDIFGSLAGKTFGINISKVNWGRIPYLAQGGVVTGPTPAMIGEGKYSEAVIPLDDSPQMNDLIDKIVEAIDKNDPDPKPVEVKVYIGDKEYDAYTYKASERGRKIVGKQPVKIGG